MPAPLRGGQISARAGDAGAVGEIEVVVRPIDDIAAHDETLSEVIFENEWVRAVEFRLAPGDAARAAGFVIERAVIEAEGICPACAGEPAA